MYVQLLGRMTLLAELSSGLSELLVLFRMALLEVAGQRALVVADLDDSHKLIAKLAVVAESANVRKVFR